MSSPNDPRRVFIGALALFASIFFCQPASAQSPPLGYGVIHAFQTLDNNGHNADGASAYGALTPGGDGYLYSVNSNGGIYGGGTIFKLRPDGTGFQTLYSFSATNTSSP